ncbi:hypothetical protein [Corynebacterium sp. ES2715-CONJ3]|uniref:hypothetical protein n=1 Tax=Corynebacterium sp. ES2715-CONJ3 TaxID=2974028 RepID=UPI002168E2FE|nr:hypothetical protein [Corynebacterium sp. ES2715-CONJ3]MCS4490888.1 hypothetical protein [Corynebacterium sp. ES2715-CONJ3]
MDPIEECLHLAASGLDRDIEDAIEKLEKLLATVDDAQQGRIHIYLCEMHAEFNRWDRVKEHALKASSLPFSGNSGWCWLEYARLQTEPGYTTPVAQLLQRLNSIALEPAHEFTGLQLLTMLENTWQGRKFLRVFIPWLGERRDVLFSMVPDSIVAILERNLALLDGLERIHCYERVLSWPEVRNTSARLDFYIEFLDSVESSGAIQDPVILPVLQEHTRTLADLALMQDSPGVEFIARKKYALYLMAGARYPEALIEIDRLMEFYDWDARPEQERDDAKVGQEFLSLTTHHELQAMRIECLVTVEPGVATEEALDILADYEKRAPVSDYGVILALYLHAEALKTGDNATATTFLGERAAHFAADSYEESHRGRSLLALVLAERAQRLYQDGHCEEAMSDIYRALKIEQINEAVEFLVRNIWEHVELDRHGLDMVSSVTEAVRYLYDCGIFAQSEGDWSSAIYYLGRCVEIAEHSPDPAHRTPLIYATYEMGAVREELGENESAALCYRNVIDMVENGEFNDPIINELYEAAAENLSALQGR